MSQTIRLLQWNILADGLGNDGFLSTEFQPIQETSEKNDNGDSSSGGYNAKEFMNLVREAKRNDEKNGALKKMKDLKNEQKQLKKLKEKEGTVDHDANKVEKQKEKIASLEKDIDTSSELVKLKKQFQNSPQLKQVDEQILNWDVRFKRIKKIIMNANPDVITFQEMDHLQQFMKDPDFGRIYTCHVDGSNDYKPASYYKKGDSQKDDLCSENYLNHLLSSRVAFAPKSYSNARTFRQKKTKPGNDKESNHLDDGSSTIDDDGVAIFWKRDKFKPIELGFLQYPSSSPKSEALVAVVLQHLSSKKLINIVTTHLPSGDEEKKEIERLDVLRSPQNKTWIAKSITAVKGKWKESDYEGLSNKFDGVVSFVKHYADRKSSDSSTTIFPLDANSRPLFPLVLPASSSVGKNGEKEVASSQEQKKEKKIWKLVRFGMCCNAKIDSSLSENQKQKTNVRKNLSSAQGQEQKTNVWNTILKGIPDFESIWVQNKLLDQNGRAITKTTFPVSVNKMRGPSSNQPAKIGEHQCELIDHVFTNAPKSKLIKDTKVGELAPNIYDGKEGNAELELYPTTNMPSDHLPVVVEITCIK